MYRDQFNTCVSCGESTLRHAGAVQQCPLCGASLVSDQMLQSMRVSMDASPELAEIRAVHRTEGEPRHCPECQKIMDRLMLQGVEVDRCKEHGFWFDPKELQRVLLDSGEQAISLERDGFWRRLVDTLAEVLGVESEEPEHEEDWDQRPPGPGYWRF